MSQRIIPRTSQEGYFITIHTNLKTKKLKQINQVSRAINNYFQGTFPHRKEPYQLLIVNERYPEGNLKDYFHLHILLSEIPLELYKNARVVKDFCVRFPLPGDSEALITHQQIFLNHFFNQMKYNKQPLLEQSAKQNFYGNTEENKVCKVIPVKDLSQEALCKYLEKEQDDLGIDLLDTYNSLFLPEGLNKWIHY